MKSQINRPSTPASDPAPPQWERELLLPISAFSPTADGHKGPMQTCAQIMSSARAARTEEYLRAKERSPMQHLFREMARFGEILQPIRDASAAALGEARALSLDARTLQSRIADGLKAIDDRKRSGYRQVPAVFYTVFGSDFELGVKHQLDSEAVIRLTKLESEIQPLRQRINAPFIQIQNQLRAALNFIDRLERFGDRKVFDKIRRELLSEVEKLRPMNSKNPEAVVLYEFSALHSHNQLLAVLNRCENAMKGGRGPLAKRVQNFVDEPRSSGAGAQSWGEFLVETSVREITQFRATMPNRKIETPLTKMQYFLHLIELTEFRRAETVRQLIPEGKERVRALKAYNRLPESDKPVPMEQLDALLRTPVYVDPTIVESSAPSAVDPTRRALKALEQYVPSYPARRSILREIEYLTDTPHDHIELVRLALAEAVLTPESPLVNESHIDQLLSDHPALFTLAATDDRAFATYLAELHTCRGVINGDVDRGEFNPGHYSSPRALSAYLRPLDALPEQNQHPEQDLIERFSTAGYDNPELAYSLVRYALHHRNRYVQSFAQILPVEFSRSRTKRCYEGGRLPSAKEIRETVRQLAGDGMIVLSGHNHDQFVLQSKFEAVVKPSLQRALQTILVERPVPPEVTVKFSVRGGESAAEPSASAY